MRYRFGTEPSGAGVGLRVLITGPSGFVGQRTVAAFIECGFYVRAAYRSDETARKHPPGVDPYIVGDLDGGADWSRALAGIDAVVHLAARVHVARDRSSRPLAAYRQVNTGGTIRLANAAADAGVRRLVFVSSIKVNGETSGGAPLSETSSPAPRDPYAISKWEAEQALHRLSTERGLEVVVLRPPLVYGPGVRANFLRLLEGVAWGLPFPFGEVENRRSLLFVGNLADALMRCAQHPAAAGQTFLVSDGRSVSSRQLVRALAHAMGRNPRLIRIPPSWLRAAGRLTRREEVILRVTGSLEVDSSQIRRLLDWAPPYTMEQGIRETVDWWRTQAKV
jgi:nucleoside-diphosphate-sugar epimerase